MDTYPGDPEVSVKIVHTYEQKNWQLRKLCMGSHTGTHVDAFSHMDAGGKSLDEIPLERFFSKTYLVEKDQPYPEGVGMLFDEEISVKYLERIVSAMPPFIGGFISEELERALLEREIITYTGLVNLDQLPKDKPFMFYGFPLKIKDGDGSPVRAVAVVV